MTFNKALNYVRSKRSIICPNFGCQNELKRYELNLKKNEHPNKHEESAKIDTAAERKIVFDFLSEEKKRPLKAENNYKYSHLLDWYHKIEAIKRRIRR